ncbi:Uncharacterised protein [Mycobacteroides abscessus]|nr:Uncharacterised protein [Mycobacteroides abscessus]
MSSPCGKSPPRYKKMGEPLSLASLTADSWLEPLPLRLVLVPGTITPTPRTPGLISPIISIMRPFPSVENMTYLRSTMKSRGPASAGRVTNGSSIGLSMSCSWLTLAWSGGCFCNSSLSALRMLISFAAILVSNGIPSLFPMTAGLAITIASTVSGDSVARKAARSSALIFETRSTSASGSTLSPEGSVTSCCPSRMLSRSSAASRSFLPYMSSRRASSSSPD